MVHVIPVGTSEPQDFAIYDDDVPLNGNGLTVGIEVFTEDGGTFSPAPSVAWLDQLAGTVTVTGTDGLVVGSYRVRFSLADHNNLVGYAPNGQPAMQWEVVQQWA